MGKTMLGVFFGLIMVIAGASAALAHQAGGVEIGDLETGSVVGQPFKELDVDAELFAIEMGNLKTWYPPTTAIDFKVRAGRPGFRSGHQGDQHLFARAWIFADGGRNPISADCLECSVGVEAR